MGRAEAAHQRQIVVPPETFNALTRAFVDASVRVDLIVPRRLLL
ncbi:MAG TPA: hypothetical protein VFJ02_16080 [Vicinamibacterales bacterium]|nr:hypothetical protein [Vicinamibacterales bacterium]